VLNLVASLSLLFAAPLADDPSPPEKVLTGSEKTKRFEIRFRPGSRAESSVDRTKVMAERDLDRILARLEFKEWNETIRLFLYDDVDELKRITGVGAAGYSTPLESHVPYDNDQTRLHELVHVVAQRFKERGPEPRSLFFAEGLANAVLEFVTGVHVDAVAAFYRQRKQLPTLAELHAVGDYYSWLSSHPGFNGYDVGGSWILWLLDTFGAKKVRSYCAGVPAREAFGKSLEELEKGWHARLDKVVLRPGLDALLRERQGEKVEFPKYVAPEHQLDARMLGDAKEWEALDAAEFAASGPGGAERKGGALSIRGPKDTGIWSEAALGTKTVGDGWLRATISPQPGCWAVKIAFGGKCQAMLLGNGAFLYNEVGGVDSTDAVKLGSTPVELVLRREHGRATVWIDGVQRLAGGVAGDAALPTLGVVQGEASFGKVAVRALH